jgi:hypothetical protein
MVLLTKVLGGVGAVAFVALDASERAWLLVLEGVVRGDVGGM